MPLKYHHFNSVPFEAHMQIFNLINDGENVLDVGCATGYFARKLKEKNCKVIGIEIDPSAAKLAEKVCKKVFVGDVISIASFPITKNAFDVILMLDVLEHLKNPETVLPLVRSYLKNEGRLIISTPNIVHISVRMKMLMGNFDYQESGILDKAHLRFFTKENLIKTVREAGFEVDKVECSADFGQLPFFGRVLRRVPKKIQYLLTKSFNDLLAVQFIVVCRR